MASRLRAYRLMLLPGALLATLLSGGLAHAQEAPRVQVEGVVTDAETGQPLPLATVAVAGSFTGTAADAQGRYRLRARPGQRLRFQALGYEPAERPVETALENTLRLDVALAPDRIPLGAITVEAERETAPSLHRISAASARNAPALGEPDLVRAAAFLPGVTQANDFQSRLHVRGGASDQNLYLLDGVEVYDPRHLIGVFSAFNPWALQGATLYAGAFPAEYAGRLSSVLALETRAPSDTLDATLNVSLLSSSAALTHRRGNTGLLLAARRTYLDLLARAATLDLGYRFYDANLKLTQRLAPDLDLEVLGFTNVDVARQWEADGAPEAFRDSLQTRTRWGNRMGALRLKHRAGRLRHHLTASYSARFDGARYAQGAAFADNTFRDLGLRYDAQLPFRRHRLVFGAHVRRFTNDYAWDARLGLDLDEVFYDDVPLVFDAAQALTLTSFYLAEDVFVGPRLLATLGGRFTTPGALAEGVAEPRLHLRYTASRRLTLSAGAGLHHQFVAEGRQGDELSIGSPLFLFERPQRAWITSLGGTLALGARYRLQAEVYYRGFRDVVALQETEPEDFPRFERRPGRAYGLDVLAEKTRGWITFQAAYTFLRSEQERDGRYVLTDYDVPHTLQGVLGFRLGRSWLLNLAGIYRSGTPFTPVVGRFYAPGHVDGDLVNRTGLDHFFRRYLEGEPNAFRYPAYTRLDLSLRRTYQAERFRWTLYVQALNLFNRKNALRVDWTDYYRFTHTLIDGEPGFGDPERALPVLPSLGVEIVF